MVGSKVRSGVTKRTAFPLFLTMVFGLFLGCGPKPSPLIITDDDREIFDTILNRKSDEVRFFVSYDSTPIACTVIRPDVETIGTILFIHGITTRSGLYVPLADSLASHGYQIYMMDIRGHGYSHGERGDAPPDSSLMKDARDFYRFVRVEEGERLPIVVMGHSLGTIIWITTLGSFPEIEVDGLVLISGGIPPKDMLKKQAEHKDVDFFYPHPLILMASVLFPTLKPIEIIIPDEPQMEGQGFVTRYTTRFFRSIHVSNSLYDYFYDSFQMPILMISGQIDEVVPVDLIRTFYNKVESEDKTLRLIDNATHTSILWKGAPDIREWLDERFLLRHK